MRKSEAEKLLQECEFKFVRKGASGDIWTDLFGSRIAIGADLEGRRHHNFLADLKRAVKNRPVPLDPQAERDTKIIIRKAEAAAPPLELIQQEEEEMPQEPVPSIATSKKAKIPMIIMAILTDPDLTDTQKVKMLMSYAELN